MKFEVEAIKSRGAILAAAAIAVHTAAANVVAWYHFDEVAPGNRYTSSDTVLNAVDPAKLSGKAYSMGVYGTTDYLTLGSDPDFMPTATNSAPDVVQVFDPVNGTVFRSDRSLYFRYADDTPERQPCSSSSRLQMMFSWFQERPPMRSQRSNR